MALNSKELGDLDRYVAQILRKRVDESGKNRRTLASETGMSMNRIGIILREEPPPATVGEVEAIAEVVGSDSLEVLTTAKRQYLSEGGYILAASDRDVDSEVESWENLP